MQSEQASFHFSFFHFQGVDDFGLGLLLQTKQIKVS